MAQQQNHNNSDVNVRHNAVLERLEALEAKNRILKEKIARMEAANLRHYFLLGLLFYMLVPVPIISGITYVCVIVKNPWLWVFSTVCNGLLLSIVFDLVKVWVKTAVAGQAMCEPLRELMEMAEAQEADRRELRQEEEAIHRAQERRRCQEQIWQQLREMAGRGRDAQDTDIPQVPEPLNLDEDVAQCTICLEQFNLYGVGDGDVAILTCQHIFHRACIVLWLQCKHTCPVCRTKTDTYYWWRRIPDMDG